MQRDADKWNGRYRDGGMIPGEAAEVLRENLHLLPPRGYALDLACGLGANALLLARLGLETCAWDIAASAIDKLRLLAAGLPLQAEVRDVTREPPEPHRFDVIVVSRFLDRALAPSLAESLKPNGLLFYQTFTRTCVGDSGPRNSEYRLADGELLQLFPGLKLRVYREEGTIGDISRGLRNQAMLVAQRQDGIVDVSL